MLQFFEHMPDVRLSEILKLRREPMPYECTVYILYIVTEALNAIHKVGLCHGQVSADFIYIDFSAKQIKIADPGIMFTSDADRALV